MEEPTIENNSPQKSGINYSVYVIIIIVILVIVVGGMYLLKKNAEQSMKPPAIQPTRAMTTTTPTAAAATTPTSVSVNNAAMQKITVTGSNFAFSPKLITVKKNVPVEITFTSAEGGHNFVINAFNVKSQFLAAGQSQTLTFTPDKTGSFTYYCSVANHRAMGMEGTLVVE